MIDVQSDTPEFVKISEAKRDDKTFLQYLYLAAHSMIVFDYSCFGKNSFDRLFRYHLNGSELQENVCEMKSKKQILHITIRIVLN